MYNARRFKILFVYFDCKSIYIHIVIRDKFDLISWLLYNDFFTVVISL